MGKEIVYGRGRRYGCAIGSQVYFGRGMFVYDDENGQKIVVIRQMPFRRNKFDRTKFITMHSDNIKVELPSLRKLLSRLRFRKNRKNRG